MTEKSILLGEQDYELLRLLSHGAGNRKIAEALCKSAFTVRNHLSRLYKKIKVANRVQAVSWFNARQVGQSAQVQHAAASKDTSK